MMYPASFDYYRAGSLEEAIALLGQHEGAKLLAGGHSLIPMLKLRLLQPPALIDIGRIPELHGISVEGDVVRIGALTTHAELAGSQELHRGCRILAEAAARIGDPQVRNKGTIGGNIAHADPASDLPAVLVATGATIRVMGARGQRQIPAEDFFVGLLATAASSGEVITAIDVSVLEPGAGCCYLKMEHPASGYAACGAAAIIALADDGACEKASLCLNGVAATPVRGNGLAAALQGVALDDATIDRAVDTYLKVDDPLADVYISAAFRAHLARVYAKRALKQARDRAAG